VLNLIAIADDHHHRHGHNIKTGTDILGSPAPFSVSWYGCAACIDGTIGHVMASLLRANIGFTLAPCFSHLKASSSFPTRKFR
jgi:hypothetical protein